MLTWFRGWRRLFAVLAAVVVVLALAAYAAAASVVYDRLSVIDPTWCPAHYAADTPAHFSVQGVDRAPSVDLSAYSMPEYETVSFPSRGGQVTISGWWVPGHTADAPAVVVVHGHGKCKHDPEALLPAGMLHRHGFAVLLIDLRNHGDSGRDDGRYAGGIKEYRDVLGAWDWLRSEKGLPPGRIGLLGVSLGGASVMLAMGQEPRVAATWEDSGPADIGRAIEDLLRASGYPTWLMPGGIVAGRVLHGVDLTSMSPESAVADLHGRPIYIVHGTADTTVLVYQADILAEAVREGGGSVEPWILPGVTHVRAAFVAPGEYERRLAAFFTMAIGSPA